MSTTNIFLPHASGALEAFDLRLAKPVPAATAGAFPRVAYAAAHVVADPLRLSEPWGRPAVDWDATLAFRRQLWSLGFKVAEAMDTAQRGMGFDWPLAAELIRRSTAEARSQPGADLACGVGTDQLDPAGAHTLDQVLAAYEAQLEHVEACGGRAILMASRALCRAARHADDYLGVYARLISGAREKVVLHWLGEAFDPALRGYWGSGEVDAAMRTVLALIEAHAGKIDGIKISLLDAAQEVKLRAALPAGVKMYTGDDFNYAALIEGDGQHHSHALLGILDPIAPVAAAALRALGAGERERYRELLAPTVALSRKIFEAPTPYYKAGVVFLAWLNGHQSHFRMVGGMESARGIVHYAEVFRLACLAGVIADVPAAAVKMRTLCALNGIG